MENKNNTSKIIYITLIVFLLLIIGMCIYIIFDNKKAMENNGLNENEINDELDEELDVTNQLIFDDILVKFEKITGIIWAEENAMRTSDEMKQTVNGKIIYNVPWTYLSGGKLETIDNILSGKFSELDKLKIALNTTTYNTTSVQYENMNFDKSGIPDAWKNYFKEISTEFLENNYFDLFGEKIKNYVDFVKFGGMCDKFYYDKINNNYYRLLCPGGGSGAISFIFFIDEIKQKNDEIFIDFYLLTDVYGDGEFVNKRIICDYSGLDVSELLNYYDEGTCMTNNNLESNIDEILLTNDDNMSKFKRNRFIFKKNSIGIYNFVRIEKK